MIGKTISHYKITEKLGEGGMGVVYKAEDTKLKRFVALKFLPPNLTHNPEANERFIHEAQAASALDHPNICTVHDIKDTGDGQMYIIMTHYEGKTLKDIITQGPMEAEKTINIAIQISHGLVAAHKKGIIHRDIKSANIMITDDGQVKIMDFGLAKLSGQTQLTKTGSTMGTVAYMSPEQVRSEKIDLRTDIWSLGVVLYEMFCSQLPFKGEYGQAVMYSITRDDPEPFLPGISPGLQQVIYRALQKKREQRYQSSTNLLIDLKRVQRGSEKVSQKPLQPVQRASERIMSEPNKEPKRKRLPVFSVVFLTILVLAIVGYFVFLGRSHVVSEQITLAVADFVNKTDEKELDGLSDFLITALDQSKRLEVLTISHMHNILRQMGIQDFERFDEPVARAICRQANVNTLVTASIRKLGKLYVIDLKVFDVQKNKHLYTDRAQGEGQESVPGMIDELSAGTRKALREKEKQIQQTSEKVADISTSNLEAHSHYFAGLQAYHYKRNYPDAIEKFGKAIELDSTFALARFWLAYTTGLNSPDEKFKSEQIEEALAFSDRMPERERTLLKAVVAMRKIGWRDGIAILMEMKKKYPNDMEMIYRIGDFYFHAGHFDSAVVYFEKETKMGGTHSLHHLCWLYQELGQYEKMLEAAQRWVSIIGSPSAYYSLAKAADLSDRKTEHGIGVEILKTARRFRPDDDKELLYYIGEWYYGKGQFDSAAVYFEKGLEIDPTNRGMLSLINLTYECLGLYVKMFEAAKLWAEFGGWGRVHCYTLAKASVLSGRFIEGIGLLDQVRQSFPKRYFVTAFIADIYAHQEQYARAEAELKSLIREDQPPAVRQTGFNNLLGVYPYMGRYRDALEAADKTIELSWQMQDTAEAIRRPVLKELIRLWGWGDVDHKILEDKKQNFSSYSYFSASLSLLQFYRGDYVSADSLANHLLVDRRKFIGFLIQMKQDCASADSIDNDPSWKPMSNTFHIQIYYQLAHCYLSTGQFVKAERSLQRLRSTWEAFYSRAVFYPKSFYLEGKIHEKKGDREKAIQSYEKLLELWQDADKDLPELIDAKNSLKKLKNISIHDVTI